MSSTKWEFPDQESGLTDYHSIPTAEALDRDLETFVREVLQNANDQRLDNDDPARVTFDLRRLTDELPEFLGSLKWGDEMQSPSQLRWHVERATENDQARDPGLRRFLNGFDEEELLVLTIHDENTTGLVGSETDNSEPYGALVKDFGGSQKPDSSSGGSFGLGKTVLWAFSGVSTVLFNSVPYHPEPDHEPPRLVGRSILPAHEHRTPERTFTNHGWFGEDDEEEIERLGRPPSLWDDDGAASDLAESLCVDRPSDRPGTSIGVVGFRVPGEDLHPDPSELSAQFRHAAVKHFWPAMVRDELEVFVRTPDGGQTQATYDDAPGVQPFVECYGAAFADHDSELSSPGEIGATTVEVTVPAENGEVVDDPTPEYETECDLIVRRLSPTDAESLDADDDSALSRNTVARLRGAQMIVDYVDENSLGDRASDFVAVLVCGEAQAAPGMEPTDEQRALEQFLKRSEPTQHDEWKGSKNDYLKKFYSGTIVKEVAALAGDRLEAALAELVREEVESGDSVPDMDDVAPVTEGRDMNENGGGKSAIKWDERPETEFDGRRWTFSGEGGPRDDDHGEWTVALELVRLDSDESTSDAIPVDSVTPQTAGVGFSTDGDGVKLNVPADTDTVAFEGESEPVVGEDVTVSKAFELGLITQAKLRVSAEVSTGGGE